MSIALTQVPEAALQIQKHTQLFSREDNKMSNESTDIHPVDRPGIKETQTISADINDDYTETRDDSVPSGNDYRDYRESTHSVTSKIAYLIGVKKGIFKKEHSSFDLDIFNKLDTDKNARIIRHLCTVRTSIFINFNKINNAFKLEHRGIRTVGEFIPDESVRQLSEDGIDFVKKTSRYLSNHVVEINRLINDRINNCRGLFPMWLNWEYVKDLFIMKDGLTDNGVMAALMVYRNSYNFLPFHAYLNWNARDEGLIIASDYRFCTWLYQLHNDEFTARNMVTNVGSYVTGNIYDFISSSGSTVLVVDCENSDPFNLSAAFRNLERKYTEKISRIILFDDIHSSTAWKLLEDSTGNIPVEHLTVERLMGNKSLVDQALYARVFREFYENRTDSFVLVSSDSDYWPLVSNLPQAKFLVMIEHAKCSPNLKQALEDQHIFYCYLDDFYGGSSEDVKHKAVLAEMRAYIESTVRLNVNDMFEEALRSTRAPFTEDERKRFYRKFIKPMSLVIDDNGDVQIEFGR